MDGSALQRLVRAIRVAFPDADWRDIADIAWLAVATVSVEAQPPEKQAKVGDVTNDASIEEDDASTTPGPSTEGPSRAASRVEPGRRGAAASGRGTVRRGPRWQGLDARAAAAIDAMTVSVADTPSLPGGTGIARALRPFKRRRPSTHEWQLDPTATVDGWADTGLLVPRFRPVRERWFDVALVVDRTPTVTALSRTVGQFERLLRRHGAFRSVTIYDLHGSGRIRLRSRTGSEHHPHELIDVLGNRLTLVVSDCTDSRWRYPGIWDAIAEWSRFHAVAIVQSLPASLWSATATGPADMVVRAHRPGQPTLLLAVDPPWWWPIGEEKHPAVPVIGLDGVSIDSWARMVMGEGGVGVPAIAIRPPDPTGLAERSVYGDLDAHELVARARSTISPAAFRLAVLLSVLPFSFELAQVVQRHLLPDSRVEHLAEVLVSGLVVPQDDDGKEWTFRDDEVRHHLLDLLDTTTLSDVLDVVARYLRRRGVTPRFALSLRGRIDPGGVVDDPAANRIHRTLAELSTRLRLPGTETEPVPESVGTVGHEVTESAATTVVDGRPVVVIADTAGSLRVLDLAGGDPLLVVDTRAGPFLSLAVATTRDRSVAITGGESGTAQVWDLADGTLVRVLSGPPTRLATLDTITLDGRTLVVAGGHDGMLRLWELDTGVRVSVLTGHPGPVSELATSVADGRALAATGGEDGTVRVWGLTDTDDRPLAPGALVHELDGHVGPVSAAVWIDIDGRVTLATGGDDGSVRMWDVVTGMLGVLRVGHDGPVVAMATAVLEGGPVVVTSGVDATVRVWTIADGRPGRVIASTAVASWLVTGVIDDRPVAVWPDRDGTVATMPLYERAAVPPVEPPHAPPPPARGRDAASLVDDDERRTIPSQTVVIDAPEEAAPATQVEIGVGFVDESVREPRPAPVPSSGEGILLAVQLSAAGCAFPEGNRRLMRVNLEDSGGPLLWFIVETPDTPVVTDIVLNADLSVDGQLVGQAWRSLRVVPTSAPAALTPPPEPGQSPVVLERTTPVDLTITVLRGQDDDELLWLMTTPFHDVDVPEHQISTRLASTNARSFALELSSKMERAVPGLVEQVLRGVSRTVARAIPEEVWRVLARVWRAVDELGRERPSVLVVTTDPWVPWELASAEEEFLGDAGRLPDPTVPALLGCQLAIGRWLLPRADGGVAPAFPALPPPSRLDLSTMAVVFAPYGHQFDSKELPAAAVECDELAVSYPSLRLEADLESMLDLLNERVDPPVGASGPIDLIHIAGHGRIDQLDPVRNGIVLADDVARLGEQTVAGGWLGEGQPMVFLNSAQLATTSMDLLGDQGGLASAFLSIGARAFVAPLWSIDDTVARRFAVKFHRLCIDEGVSAGEAMRRLRSRFADDPTSSTWLAYTYFGHPELAMSDPSAAPATDSTERRRREGLFSDVEAAEVDSGEAPGVAAPPQVERGLMAGGEDRIELRGGLGLMAPGLRGRAEAVGAADGIATRSLAGMAPVMSDALDVGDMSVIHVVTVEVDELDLHSADVGPRSATGDPAIVLDVQDLGPEVAQVVLSVDEAGAISWVFPSRSSGEETDTPGRPGARLRFRAPIAVPPPEIEEPVRGLLGSVGRKVMVVVAWRIPKGVLSLGPSSLAGQLAEQRRRPRVRTFLPGEHGRDDSNATTVDWWSLAAGPSLWFVHDVLSAAHGSFGDLDDSTLNAIHERYDGRVVAFDHYTVHEDPVDNVAALARLVPNGLQLDADIIAHGRGGLVARALAGEGADPGVESPLRLRRVVTVGTPHHGTPLGDLNQLPALLDRVTTMLNLAPRSGIVEELVAVLDVVKVALAYSEPMLPGIAAMSTEGSWLAAINREGRDTGIELHTIAANLEPRGGLRRLARAEPGRDALVDRVFEFAANDVVVPVEGAWRGSDGPLFPVPEDRRLLMDASEGVDHYGYFRSDRVRSALLRWLG